MKTLKETLQESFVVALKAKDETAKSAISGVKAKITEAEKTNGNKELSDQEVIKVIAKAIKQRRESQEIYEKAGREELAKKECDEACVLESFMPKQMSPQEITDALIEIMQGFSVVITNPNAFTGKTIGEFNKRYPGRADIGTVKMLLANLVQIA
jgi:uncharacterized protein YqeY